MNRETMARRFDLIVFDWDGTLLDSPGAIVAAIQAACVDLGVAPPDDRQARQVIGLGLNDALGAAVPQLERSRYRQLAERYRHHYMASDHELNLFPGAADLVRRLHGRGHQLGVATGKTRAGLERAMAHAGLGAYFHATRCADECFSKPHPAMLLELMDCLGTEAQRTLMVGDTTHDLQMARNAAVPSLAVSFGAHRREDLLPETPLACLGSFEELAQWFDRNA